MRRDLHVPQRGRWAGVLNIDYDCIVRLSSLLLLLAAMQPCLYSYKTRKRVKDEVKNRMRAGLQITAKDTMSSSIGTLITKRCTARTHTSILYIVCLLLQQRDSVVAVGKISGRKKEKMRGRETNIRARRGPMN